jgi:hypothetical protein|tara:strand:- start:879 stop:1742 length:864 start_codon:yes stop_codon:yes gene_type:complete
MGASGLLLLVASAGASYVVPARTPLRVASRTRTPLLQQGTDKAERSGLLGFLQPNVPKDQQPVAELQTLRRDAFYDWASEDEGYRSKLIGLYQNTMLFLSLPISFTTFNQLPYELPQLLLAANIGTSAVLFAFVLRLRLGWGFVSNRLKARATYFEANERANVARKDRETSLRDRLIEQQEVQPALKRIDVSLAAIGAALVLSLAAGQAITAIEGEAGPSTLKTLYGEDSRRFENRLKGDDEFALREQTRARRKADEDGNGVKPLYCDSRYYKILAGGNGQGGVGCN